MKPLTKLIEQLSDVGQIDWERCRSEHPELNGQMDQLQRLAKVTHAFKHCVTQRSGADGGAGALFTWGHLQALELIGEGGFGQVYRAYDQLLDRDVALKLRRDEQSPLSTTRAFISEARRLAQVRHPNVLAVHGAGVHNNRVGLWADLLSGETVADLLRRSGPLDRARSCRIAIDVMRALSAIHRARLIHGDVKASNLMIEADGRAVLMDFGAGAEAIDADASARLLQGSPLFMAPELLAGGGPSQAADMYSCGVLVHLMLYGTYPVHGNSVAELRGAHESAKRVHRSRGHVGLPKPLVRLLDRLLATDPQHRPTAEQALAQLLWMEGTPARRKRQLFVAAAMLSLAVALIVSLFALQRVSAARSAAQAQFERAQKERANAIAVNDFFARSVRAAAPLRQDGVGSVHSMYQSMAARVDTELGEFPEALANMRLVIGDGLYDYGDHEAGLALSERGLEELRALSPIPPKDRIRALELVAIMYRHEHRLDEAERLTREALDLLAASPPDDPKVRNNILSARNLLANVLGDRGDLLGSIVEHERVLADRTALLGPDAVELAANYNNIGRANEELSRWPQALAAFTAAEKLLLSAGLDGSIKTALVRSGIGNALIGMGRHAEGKELLLKARSRYLQDYGSDHDFVRAIDIALADLLNTQGHPDTALNIYADLLADGEYTPTFFYLQNRVRAYIGLQQWRAVHKDYQRQHELLIPEEARFQQYLDSAIAWSAYKSGQGDPPSLAQLRQTRQNMIAFGIEPSPELKLIDAWINELEGSVPATLDIGPNDQPPQSHR